MPKDPKRNVDRYKVRGGDLNEFDFHQRQEEFAETRPKTSFATKGTKSTKSTKGKKNTRSTKKATTKKGSARKGAKK